MTAREAVGSYHDLWDVEQFTALAVARFMQEAQISALLDNITRDYPFATHHVARGLADLVPASERNPAFANSFDWHSSVHMHYLLTSLLDTEMGRDASWRDEAIKVLSFHLSRENMLAEADFLRNNPSWERP